MLRVFANRGEVVLRSRGPKPKSCPEMPRRSPINIPVLQWALARRPRRCALAQRRYGCGNRGGEGWQKRCSWEKREGVYASKGGGRKRKSECANANPQIQVPFQFPSFLFVTLSIRCVVLHQHSSVWLFFSLFSAPIFLNFVYRGLARRLILLCCLFFVYAGRFSSLSVAPELRCGLCPWPPPIRVFCGDKVCWMSSRTTHYIVSNEYGIHQLAARMSRTRQGRMFRLSPCMWMDSEEKGCCFVSEADIGCLLDRRDR